jgi:hypothetical protein
LREIPLQSRLIEWIKDEGGYGRKLSNRFLVGIPDLLLRLGLGRRVLVVAEVKALDFVRKTPATAVLPVTPKQRDELRKFEVGVVLVGVNLGNRLHSVYALPPDAEMFESSWPSVTVENGRPSRPLTGVIRSVME